MIKIIKKITRSLGFDVIRYSKEKRYLPDMPPHVREIYKTVSPYTMSSPERIYALCEAARYISENAIEGSIVECGVWKGGSMMAVAKSLMALDDTKRDLYLFDTFEGMSPPTSVDKTFDGVSADGLLDCSKDLNKESSDSVWCCANLQTVKEAMLTTGYPGQKIHFVEGKVEQTIPMKAPQQISLLRLDTDWYESTRHEMEQLFPRLIPGGVIIIDDYGHWQGAKKAIDEYIKANQVTILLNRIDYTGRIAVKLQ